MGKNSLDKYNKDGRKNQRKERNTEPEVQVAEKKESLEVPLMQTIYKYRMALVLSAVLSVFAGLWYVSKGRKLDFDIQTYKPPSEGVVLDKVIHPHSTWNIIELLDLHPSWGRLQNDADSIAMQSQVEAYDILEDLIQKYGKIYLEIENLYAPVAPDPSFITPDNMQILEQADPVLAACIQETDLTKRRKLIRERFLGKCDTPAAHFIALAYPDDCIQVPCLTMQEALEVQELAKKYEDMRIILQSPDAVLYVKHKGEQVLVNLDEVIMAFKEGRASPEVIASYCAFRRRVDEIINAYRQNRWIQAPEQEVEAAMSVVNPHHYPFVLTHGTYHAQRAQEIMRERGISYVVLGTETLGNNRSFLHQPPAENPLQDNANCDCEKVERTEKEESSSE